MFILPRNIRTLLWDKKKEESMTHWKHWNDIHKLKNGLVGYVLTMVGYVLTILYLGFLNAYNLLYDWL